MTQNNAEIEKTLSIARRQWLSLGVWYAIDEALPPSEPERLLLETAWLFAYDFHFQGLVAAWVKYRGNVLDLEALKVLISGNSTSILVDNECARSLSLAYLFALARMMVWEDQHWGLRRCREWFSVAATARLALGNLPLTTSKLVDATRLDEIKRLTSLLRFRPDPYLRRLGLNLPQMGISEERKILPQGYVQSQLKREGA